ncbi:MAG: hypothetical protein WCI51_13025 [Lentisphaerota bacterium]
MDTNHTTQSKVKELPADIVVLGFTGTLGSGCTFFAEQLARDQNLLYFELSQFLRKEYKKSGKKVETQEDLQKFGNQLRKKYGNDYLAKKAVERIEDEWEEGMNGVAISGIRNIGEIRFLREIPLFFLVSIHADRDIRRKRLIKIKKVKSEEEFNKVDLRDELERVSYGQQVSLCNYEADIIINNSKNIPSVCKIKRANYIKEKLTDKYISLIFAKFKSGEKVVEHTPSIREVFMTCAYCESSMSKCIKRKVGAIIANIDDNSEMERGFIISSGHNDVPEGTNPCIFDELYQKCARDDLQEKVAGNIKFCPSCGKKIKIEFKCDSCHKVIKKFLKNCPECNTELDTKYCCSACNTDIFKNFVPGKNAGKLLDVCRSLHAEENAIMNMVKNASTVDDNTVLFTTTFPCNLCANKIAELGIKKVIYAEPYPMEDAKKILNDRGIKCDKFEGVKSSAFFKLYH